MAWWDINLHTNDTVSNIWDKFQGGLKQSTANLFTPGAGFNVPKNAGEFWSNGLRFMGNTLAPGLGLGSGDTNMFARAIEDIKQFSNDPTGQVDQSPKAPGSSPADSETPVVEPEPSVDAEGSIGSTGSANVLLRRRKLQNALKYGFASTIKHYQGNTTKPVEYAEPKLLVGA